MTEWARAWQAKRDYPTDGAKLVASGLRLNASLQQVQGPLRYPDGIRWTQGSTTYEMFYDVFLTNPVPVLTPPGSFKFQFQYWYAKVKYAAGKWVLADGVNTTKYLVTTWTTITMPNPGPPAANVTAQVVGLVPGPTNLPSQGVYLPRFGYHRPRDPWSWLPVTVVSQADLIKVTQPATFGWKNKSLKPGVYTTKGVPGRGDGGSPWSSGGSTQPPPGSSWDGGSDTDNTDDDSESGTGGDEPSAEEKEPKIPGWNKKRKTLWNPPLIQYATGAYVPLDLRPDAAGGIDRTAPGTRSDLLGSGGYGTRIGRKGYIRQYLRYANDWRAEVPSEVEPEAEGAIDWTNADALVEPGKRYGFRFHYNPSSIEFGIQKRDDVNPAIVMSMPTRVMPITNGNGGNTISVRLFLNRIEDYSLIKYNSKSKQFELLDESMYGGKKLSQEDMKGIVERGTMWDMEYFFRACIGRPFKSEFRGTTADFGFIFGVPLELKLGQSMRYYGRIEGASYAHTSFTQNMVPLFTELSFTYVRYPDGTSFTGNPTDKGKGNGKGKGKGNGRGNRN